MTFTSRLALIFLSLLSLVSTALAGVECVTSASVSKTTPDYHCSKHCGDWANTRPLQSLDLSMDERWVKKDAFFNNPSFSCSGGDPCGFSKFGTPSISPDGRKVTGTFKTWSRPVSVTLSAQICFYNASLPPEPTPPAPGPKEPSGPVNGSQTRSDDASASFLTWRLDKSSGSTGIIVKNTSPTRSIQVELPLSYGFACSVRQSVTVLPGEERRVVPQPPIQGVCSPAVSKFL